MKLVTKLLLLLFLIPSGLFAQEKEHKEPDSCTSIMVGNKATTDGSVITSHTCDGGYRTWIDMVPSTDYKKDTIMTIYKGLMHTETSKDMTGVEIKGNIPQVSHTYSFLNTAYPCINEKQLGMGETTIGGRELLENPKGMFMIEELQRVAMQRCTTAREAIALMGELIKKYGYGDSGECLTVADTKEVWHFEVFGEGKSKIGGVWAAVRIPDDHVGVSANISRISTLDLNNKDYYMASDNVFSVAKKLGLWDGKSEFKFWKAYSGANYFNEKKAFSIREFFILSKLAPSLNLKYDSEELPFSVKPEKKLSQADVAALLSETYEGTEWDMMKNLKVVVKDNKTDKSDTITSPKANPWMTRDELKMINAIKPETISQVRTVSVPQCAYSTIIQLRSWLPNEIGGVVWFSVDNPAQSPRIPLYCGMTEIPEIFKTCGNHRYREDAALWHYRKANKLATVKWGKSKEMMNKNISYFKTKGISDMKTVETNYKNILNKNGLSEAKEYLNDYSSDFIGATLLRWDEMSNRFWMDNRFGF